MCTRSSPILALEFANIVANQRPADPISGNMSSDMLESDWLNQIHSPDRLETVYPVRRYPGCLEDSLMCFVL